MNIEEFCALHKDHKEIESCRRWTRWVSRPLASTTAAAIFVPPTSTPIAARRAVKEDMFIVAICVQYLLQ